MQFKSIKTKVLIGLCATCLSLSQCIAANVLSKIEISPSETQTYKISFGAQKPDEIKKIVSSDDKMVLELKGINVSENYNTIYNNVTDVDSVLVNAITKNSAKITFEGKNIADSQIFFETIQGAAEGVSGDVAEQNIATTDAIELSRPVKEYAPVYSKEYVEDMESEESYIDNLKLSLLSLIKNRQVRRLAKSGIRKAANHASKENLAYILLGIGFLALVIKVIRPSKHQEASSIGLAQTLKQREMERVQNMDIAAKIEETRQRTQEPAFNTNSGYAMKSYKSSQKNPYTSSLNRPINKSKTLNNPRQVAQQRNVVTNNKVSSPINTNSKINVDSTKFLESMAKIYEKNGRIDLARGLKANIQKISAQKQAV